MSSSVQDALATLPLKLCILTDAKGAILLRAGDASDDALLEIQRMGAAFAQTAEQAANLGLGKNLHTTAFYGAFRRCNGPFYSCRAAVDFIFFRTPPLALALTICLLSFFSLFKLAQTRRRSSTSPSRRSC